MAGKSLKGITVQIGGNTTGLSKALSDVNKESNKLNGELKEVEKLLKLDPSNVELAAQKQKLLTDAVDASRKKMSDLSAIKADVDKQFQEGKLNEEAYRAFQREVEKAGIELKTTEKSLGDFEKAEKGTKEESDKLKEKTGELKDEVEKSGEVSEEAGEKFEKFKSVMAGVGGVLAAGAAAVGAAAGAAVGALADMSKGSAQYADGVKTLSQQTGVATDDLQAYMYMAELTDVPVSTLTATMAKQIKSMSAVGDVSAEAAVDMEKLQKAQVKVSNANMAVEAAQLKYNEAVKKGGADSAAAQQAEINLRKAKNNLSAAYSDLTKAQEAAEPKTNEMTKAYQKLGVSVYDADGKMRDGQTVYWELIDALGKMEEGAERDALSMQIFGKSAQDLNPLIAQGSAGIAAFKEEAIAMGAVLSGDVLDAYAAYDDSMQRMASATKAAQNVMGALLMPQLQELTDVGGALIGEFTRNMQEAGGDWSKIGGVISDTLGSVIDKVGEMLPQLLDTGLEIVSGLAGAITDNLPKLTEVATGIITTLLEYFISILPDMIEAGIKILLGLVDGITEAIPELIPAIVEAVTSIVGVIIDNLPLLLDAALKIIMALAEGLIAAIPTLIGKVPELVKSITNALIKMLPMIIDAGMKLFSALVDALPEIITLICGVIPEIIDAIVGALVTLLPMIVEAGIELFVALVDALPEILENIVKAIPKIIDAIIDAAIELLPLIIDAGIDLFVALVDALPEIIEKIIEVIPKIIDAIQKALLKSLPVLIDAGIKLFVALVKALPEIIKAIVKVLPMIIKAVIEALIVLFPQMAEAGWKMFMALIEKIPDVIEKIKAAIPEIIESITNTIGSFVGDMAEAGLNLIKGLWQGISDAAAWLKEKISGFFGGVVDSIKNFFGIHSPSTLFYDMGGQLVEGFSLGIENSAKLAEMSMTELAERIIAMFAKIGMPNVLQDYGMEAIKAFIAGMLKYGKENTTFDPVLASVLLAYPNLWDVYYGGKDDEYVSKGAPEWWRPRKITGEKVYQNPEGSVNPEYRENIYGETMEEYKREMKIAKEAYEMGGEAWEAVQKYNEARKKIAELEKAEHDQMNRWYESGKHPVAEAALNRIRDELNAALEELNGEIGAAYWDVGEAIMEGIAQGIADNADKPLSPAERAMQDLEENYRKMLDMHSPSKVYEKFGGFIMEGLAEGIKGGAGAAIEAMVDVVEAVKQKAEMAQVYDCISEAVRGGQDAAARRFGGDSYGDVYNRTTTLNQYNTIHVDEPSPSAIYRVEQRAGTRFLYDRTKN